MLKTVNWTAVEFKLENRPNANWAAKKSGVISEVHTRGKVSKSVRDYWSLSSEEHFRAAHQVVAEILSLEKKLSFPDLTWKMSIPPTPALFLQRSLLL